MPPKEKTLQIELLDLVRPELDAVEAKMHSIAQEVQGPLGDALRYLINSGGKRLRPALAIAASHFQPSRDETPVILIAAAVEMLHTATLVHDDVIDQSLLRRGNPTLNAQWSIGATVLTGDFMFAKAATLAADTHNLRAMDLFARTLATICNGELQQLFNLEKLSQEKDRYYERIYAKTASLFATAAELGALLSGAPEDIIQALKQYGHDMGMAFQIVDDILDFVGDEDVMGKPAGSDLRQGTVTLPVFYFMQSPKGRECVEATFAVPQREREAAIAKLVARIKASEALEQAKAEAWDFAHLAQQAIADLPPTPYHQALETLATFVIDRHL